jgi:phosphopantetheinyl transferase
VIRSIAYGEAAIFETADRGFLSDVERSYFARFGHPRRTGEFIAGRLAARRALFALVPAAAGRAISIEREDDGAPRLVGLEDAGPLVISITHAKERAIAVAARGVDPIGVDLTDHVDCARIRKVARRAFPREEERALALADDRSAVRAWALKEAVAKALRMGLLEQMGFERIEVVSLEPPRVRVRGDARALELELADQDDGVRATAIVVAAHR